MDFQNFFNNFVETTGAYLPGVVGALVVLILGWFVAGLFRRLTRKTLNKTSWDDRFFKSNNVDPAKFISKLVYYLIMLIVLLVVLEILGVHNVLDPVKNMVNQFMLFIPNIIAAGIIGFAGYIIATVASEVLGFAGNTLDKYSSRLGLSSDMDLGAIVKRVVFIIVFIPLLITALDTLQLDAISDPFKGMLTTFIEAIPRIIVAGLILTVFFIGGRFLTTILKDLLKGLGVDRLASKLNLSGIIGENESFSKLIANLVFFFLMFTGIITAVEQLNFPQLSDILNHLLELSAQIIFGLVIMAVGSWIANIAHDTLAKSDTNSFVASIARFAVLGLFLAIALRTMGIANEIVNLAFGLTLGSVAVAIALSFGLGGREAAGKQMEHILKRFRNEE